jgi:nucleoside phosphorylase
MSDALAVVTAVAPETRAVLRALTRPARMELAGFRAWRGTVGARSVMLVQGGIGPERACAALTALSTSPALVISAGFAGALVDGAAAGDVALPESIVWEAHGEHARYTVPTDSWQASRAALPSNVEARALFGVMLSSAAVVASIAAKREAATTFGASTVEMEAAGLIRAARRREVEVLVVRTILDTADVSLEGLPANLDSSWGARAQLIGMPHLWPRVAALARQVPHAANALHEAVVRVLRAI